MIGTRGDVGCRILVKKCSMGRSAANGQRLLELLVGAVGEHLPLVDEEDGIGVGSVYEA